MSAPEPGPFFHVSAITGDIKCQSAGRLLQLASGVTDPNVVDDAVNDLNAAVQRERQAAKAEALREAADECIRSTMGYMTGDDGTTATRQEVDNANRTARWLMDRSRLAEKGDNHAHRT